MARFRRKDRVLCVASVSTGSRFGRTETEGVVAERRVKIPLGDKIVDGVEVAVLESNERWSELKLEDGSHLRVKMTVLSVMRPDAEYDPNGNPMYALNMAPVVAVVEVPENLRKKK